MAGSLTPAQQQQAQALKECWRTLTALQIEVAASIGATSGKRRARHADAFRRILVAAAEIHVASQVLDGTREP